MTKVDNFWQPKVDSFRVRLPLQDAEIINATLIDKLITYHEGSGEIVKEDYGAPFILDSEDGLYFKIWVQECHLLNYAPEKYIFILINSKHLKARYFEGITLKNIDLVVKEINKLGVISVSKQNLLRAEVLDIDVCVDFPAKADEFQSVVVDRHNKMAIVRSMDTKTPYRAQTNLGLELNTRNKNYPSKPHTKFYHKSTELDRKSSEFAKAFLSEVDYNNIGRFEFNLKNRRYLRHYGLDKRIKTLKDLLKCGTWRKVCMDVYQNWFVERNYVPKSGLDYKDLIIHNLQKMIDLHDIRLAYEWSENSTKNYNTRKKIRTYYHNSMAKEDIKYHEAKRIALWDEIQSFFRGSNNEHMMFGKISSERVDNKQHKTK